MKHTLGIKKEMTQIYDEDGNAFPVTIVEVKGVKLVGVRTKEKDGYTALIVGMGVKKNTTKAEKVKYEAIKEVPKYVAEFKVETLDENVKDGIGKEIDFELDEGSKIHVTGVTKGKGFAGVVKRWGFKGGPKTHGQSDRHRAPGSIGAGTTPGRVYKGKKMPGRMGGDNQTTQNLKAVKFDKEKGLLYVKGAVPGAKGEFVKITIRQSHI